MITVCGSDNMITLYYVGNMIAVCDSSMMAVCGSNIYDESSEILVCDIITMM
jgi:hypothetical protein